MREDREARGLAALRAYVEGNVTEPVVVGSLRGFQPEEVQRLLRAHRGELAAIDPARHVILESILPFK